MAGFTMQVQSAIFLLYVRWNPDNPVLFEMWYQSIPGLPVCQ